MSTPIQDGLKVKAWLDDPLMKGVFATVAARIYTEFRAADTSEKRVTAYARANALEAILVEMNAVVENGELAKIETDKQARKPREQ
jgi:hypothetical protein